LNRDQKRKNQVKTYSEEEIKAAFYNRFDECGSVYFPEKVDEEDELPERVTNAQWEMFKDCLEDPEPVAVFSEPIFVFGSNEAGVHGRGAALFARKHRGAVYGRGFGHTGNSFAIPTKDWHIRTLPLDKIKPYVDTFIEYAKLHPELKFEVTRIGCGLAGYKDGDIAPMFVDAPLNCDLPEGWRAWM
jgi:hypothetical protein